MMLEPAVTPHGALTLRHSREAPELPAEKASHFARAFERGPGHGLLWLGASEVGTVLPPVWSYWRAFGTRYMTALCALAEPGEGRTKPPVRPSPELDAVAGAAPPMPGGEYLTAAVLRDLWDRVDAACDAELAEAALPLQAFLKSRNAAWNLVGRVHFNLAENRKDEDFPFAFLATYTPQLSAAGKAQHLPLGKALQEYAGAHAKDRLLSLLMPVQRAAEHCAWLKAMVDAGEIFHPLRWTPRQAVQFLKDVPALEAAGVIVRMPGSWKMSRPARPAVKATVGGRVPSKLGMDALLDFEMEVSLDGEPLSSAEIKQLLAHTDGLALIRGKWVEIDHDRLNRTLDHFRAVEKRARAEGLSFGEAMRLVAGAGIDGGAGAAAEAAWGETVAGPWLAETLAALRDPGGRANADPGKALNGTLRPYQRNGVEWLHLLSQLGLGACLADDMGLGKTIQVLSLLLVLRQEAEKEFRKDAAARPKPSLLVAPASLLANWAGEIARFAPSLKAVVVHPSAWERGRAPPASAEKTGGPPALRGTPSATSSGGLDLTGADLAITSYGYLARAPELEATAWRLVVLDEAQAIKNPAAKQTRLVKKLKAGARIALTGTPIENRLGDLWSIFDFINPGLLGTSTQFSSFVKALADRPESPAENPYGPLRSLVRPYILRRLKTDKSIIADLPDKTEVKAFCPLSRRQAALYQKAVQDLADQLKKADGIERKGVVLASLMRLKQICNHPSQWLGDDSWAEEDSGKLGRLRDIAEVIADKQEKALVFTQFKEVTAPLAAFLGGVFGRPGLVLHGETDVRRRKELVARFQEDDGVPFFILTVKAGGAGLNLTAASHVIHFDRWWNPAVENQATDRAFRIGQTRNVLVHKFICRGTVEDRIDEMIESKKQLAGDFLSGGAGADTMLTEMKNDDLLRLVALDLNAAMKEG
jgi:superfamily II DNA or RNA helicase